MNFTSTSPRRARSALTGLALAVAGLAAHAQTTAVDPSLPTQPAATDPSTTSASPASAGSTSPASPGTGTGIGYGVDGAASSTGAATPSTSSSSSSSSSSMSSDTRTAQAGTTSSGMSSGMGDSTYSLLPYTRRGYVGLNIGRAELDADCGLGGYDCDQNSTSGYLYTGGMFNEWLGAEVGYFNSGRTARNGGGTRTHGLNLSAVARLPLGAFNVFAKGGAIYGESRVSTGALSDVSDGKRRGWGGSYGAGVGLDLTPTSAIVLEWSRYEFRFPGESGRQDVDNTSLGYIYRF